MNKQYKAIELELKQYIGRRLNEFRQRLGLSQKELGESIGISYQHIQNFEYGKNNIPAPILLMLASKLGVMPGDFFPNGTFGGEGGLEDIINHQRMIMINMQRSIDLMTKRIETNKINS